MTEQEFRELTAYQPPSPPKHSPGMSSVAAAVAAAAGIKAQSDAAQSIPPVPEADPVPQQSAQQSEPADVPPPPPSVPSAPAQVNLTPPAQFISQIHEQPAASSTLPPAPVPPVPAPMPAPVPTPAPAPAPQKPPADMVPQEKHDELMEQYGRLSERFKSLVEERDNLSRQVTDLKRALAERGESSAAPGHDFKEEIRLLGKLIDDEQTLRKVAIENGTYKPGEDTYARHDRLVNVFLNIVAHSD